MCVSPASPKGAESLSGSVLSEVCRVDRGAAVPGSEGEQVGPEAERRSLGIADRGQQGQGQLREHDDIGEAGVSGSNQSSQKKC